MSKKSIWVYLIAGRHCVHMYIVCICTYCLRTNMAIFVFQIFPPVLIIK